MTGWFACGTAVVAIPLVEGMREFLAIAALQRTPDIRASVTAKYHWGLLTNSARLLCLHGVRRAQNRTLYIQQTQSGGGHVHAPDTGVGDTPLTMGLAVSCAA